MTTSSPHISRGRELLRGSASLIAVLTSAVLVAGLCGCPPPNQTEITVTVSEEGQSAGPLTPEELIALARREGEMWWYTSLPEKQASDFLERFEAKYPFIQTRLVRGSTFETVQRIDREIAQGQVKADALHVLDPAVFTDLRRRGELYVFNPEQARFLQPEYLDSGRWWAMRAVTICMAYDPTTVPDAEAPRTWPELLAPKWRGQVGLKDAQTGGSAFAQYYLLREEYGASYWHSMATQNPALFRSESDTLAALASGQIKLAGGMLGYRVYQASRTDGASVTPIWPEDGVPMIVGPVAVLSRGPHPHTARLFVDFALSQEGQTALTEIMGCYSVRDDVDPPQGRPKLSEMKLLTLDGSWEEYRTRQDRLQAEYGRLFHAESE